MLGLGRQVLCAATAEHRALRGGSLGTVPARTGVNRA
jgi:hypothetical protein